MRRLLIVPVLLLLACSGDDPPANNDGGATSCTVASPPTGNNKQVGMACTAGGNQCAANSFATVCSCDQGAPAPCYCSNSGTGACPTTADYCGTGSKCCSATIGTMIHTCFPAGCMSAGTPFAAPAGSCTD